MKSRLEVLKSNRKTVNMLEIRNEHPINKLSLDRLSRAIHVQFLGCECIIRKSIAVEAPITQWEGLGKRHAFRKHHGWASSACTRL